MATNFGGMKQPIKIANSVIVKALNVQAEDIFVIIVCAVMTSNRTDEKNTAII